ncbi:Flp family type IVb pilin [Roseospira goensis]|uniref:Pilus assembly protein Flp/PilA n=1 Tax=Roseospira goensis TaxID=391922 RepID=A0A7W6S2A8_9PROT|nr:Flp family type IVb pilin [Roseospira goensis]MBB4287095.1 pilus assembly protein Flp/PilA [Roseospira goensis]
MKRAFAVLRSIRRDTLGATVVEYGLLAALIGIGMLVGLVAFGNNLTGVFEAASNEVSNW